MLHKSGLQGGKCSQHVELVDACVCRAAFAGKPVQENVHLHCENFNTRRNLLYTGASRAMERLKISGISSEMDLRAKMELHPKSVPSHMEGSHWGGCLPSAFGCGAADVDVLVIWLLCACRLHDDGFVWQQDGT